MNLFPLNSVIERTWTFAQHARDFNGALIPFSIWRKEPLSTMNDVRSRLYYEAFVVIETDLAYHEFEILAHQLQWHSTGTGVARLRCNTLTEVYTKTVHFLDKLRLNKIIVKRWKITDCLFDSKNGDVL